MGRRPDVAKTARHGGGQAKVKLAVPEPVLEELVAANPERDEARVKCRRSLPSYRNQTTTWYRRRDSNTSSDPTETPTIQGDPAPSAPDQSSPLGSSRDRPRPADTELVTLLGVLELALLAVARALR